MKEEIKESEVNLWLEGYNDLFSDFDHKHYSVRALSDDFLLETRKASFDKKKETLKKLNLYIPTKKRNKKEEVIIKQRLSNHFNKHFARLENEKTNLVKKGTLFTSSGIILMVTATFIIFYKEDKDILINFLIVVLEPGGWFLFWEGLGLIIFETKKRKHELEFYEKMSGCDISFISYKQ